MSLGVATAVAIFALAALAEASTSNPALQLRKTSIGKILVNSRGFTVYAFTKDGHNINRCVTVAHCMSLWPAVKPGAPLAGSGVKASLIRTITLKGGTRQLTYAGHPLYTYSADTHPGQTSYVNFSQFGGRWPALNASGGLVK